MFSLRKDYAREMPCPRSYFLFLLKSDSVDKLLRSSASLARLPGAARRELMKGRHLVSFIH
ncbi:unnamed protein product [Prunus armeniaca]|uniref:Uncharacterized protein n=1 Tax=Prunus armeniaca TaxID=36596 RepID=A0A6J5XWU7_PRUAR|nr:unnamed protein product [Prunus armeniaca]